MECKRCGGSMMMETVITLRRGLFGFRETRSQGGYCFACKIGSPMESQPSIASHPRSFIVQVCRTTGALIRCARMPRPDQLHTNAIRLSKPLSLAG